MFKYFQQRSLNDLQFFLGWSLFDSSGFLLELQYISLLCPFPRYENLESGLFVDDLSQYVVKIISTQPYSGCAEL